MPKRLLACLLALALCFASLPACSDDEDEGEYRAGSTTSALHTATNYQKDRPAPGGTMPNVDADSWTIFVYLCGSDLESEGGSATTDLAEMVAASGNDQVQVVVQTGGAASWQSADLDAKKCQSFHIQDTAITKVDEFAAQNMGLSSTLADFLSWGVATYPAEHMGVILWNHGGGSVAGVCIDERFDDDSLVLTEIDEALSQVFATMGGKFEFIGFDACLMGTLETANILASYANYMIASQEWEPADGWSYTGFLEYLAQNPAATGAEVGKVIADDYLASTTDESDVSSSTLSVIDLSKIDPLLSAFDTFSQKLYPASGDTATLTEIARRVGEVDNYGGNNKSEGYTNMVDFGGLVTACADAAPGAENVLAALEDAVVYHSEGPSHKGASGLSVYYPLRIEYPEELEVFPSVCVNPSYLSFVERITGDFDEVIAAGDSAGESKLITFAEKPHLDDDGIFSFVFDENGLKYASAVTACVYQYLDEDMVELGETYDLYLDWDTGEVADAFDGLWLSLPDGQNLAVYPADWGDDYVIYTSPIELNGEETNLRIRLYDNGDYVIEGTWDGIDEEGFSAKGVHEIKDGDTIKPLYNAWDSDDNEVIYEGEKYKVKGELEISYELLYEGDYYYNFCIEDVHGDYYYTDGVVFGVDEDGQVYYE